MGLISNITHVVGSNNENISLFRTKSFGRLIFRSDSVHRYISLNKCQTNLSMMSTILVLMVPGTGIMYNASIVMFFDVTVTMSSVGLWCLMLLMLVLLPVTLSLTQSEIDELIGCDKVKVTTEGDYYVIESNGLPNHDIDDVRMAYKPSSIKEQSLKYYVLQNPECEATAKCLSRGVIAMTRSGAPFFSPYNADMQDAVHGPCQEWFDSCEGRPDHTGLYHYHKDPTCIPESQEKKSKFIGVALDGFSIYNKYNDNGTLITSKDLDKCHGRMDNDVYRYHITDDFPYVMGCYRGKVHKDSVNSKGPCKIAEAPVYNTDNLCENCG